MERPANFLNRAKRKSTQPIASEHKTDRIKLHFRLPNGRFAIVAGPTAEEIMAAIPEWYPGAELIGPLN